MSLEKKNIRWFLSGGAGNSDPNASLGGVMSSTEIKTKNASKDTNNITGVVLRDVSGDCPDSNGAGKGQLSFTVTGTLLKFKKPGGTLGAGVDISSDGVYMVYDDDGTVFAIVEVTASSLPGTDQTDNVTVAGPLHFLFDAISKSENWYGDDEVRCIFMKNDHEEDSGTATSVGDNTLTDSSKSWTINEHVDRWIEIVSGTGVGQKRLIVSNTSEYITVTPNWNTNPAGASYKIWEQYLDTNIWIDTETEGQLDTGTVDTGVTNSLVDNDKSWTPNQFANQFVRITSGTGAGQSRQITSNTDTTLFVYPNWDTIPTGATYEITDNLLDVGLENCQVSQEEIDQGDGGTSYSGTLANYPLVSKTLVIEDELGQEKFTDYDGDGNLTGSAGGSGTINYTTGAWTLTYNANLAAGTKINADYVKWPQSVANEGTLPGGVDFSHPVSTNKLTLGDVDGNGDWGAKAIWLKYRVRKAAERLPATGTLKFEGMV